jgi:hypothetical protein
MSRIDSCLIASNLMVPSGATSVYSEWINIRSFPVVSIHTIVATGPMSHTASGTPTGYVGGDGGHSGAGTGYIKFALSNENYPSIHGLSGQPVISEYIHHPVDSGATPVPITGTPTTAITNFSGLGATWIRAEFYSPQQSAYAMSAYLAAKGGNL